MRISVNPKINGAYITEYLQKKGISKRSINEQMGKGNAFLTERIRAGSMNPADIKFLCLLTGMDESKVTRAEEVKKEKTADENTELVVSYIQDLGKIHTEILRAIREEHEAVMTELKAMHDVLENMKSEEHRDAEKLYNYFKYGKR